MDEIDVKAVSNILAGESKYELIKPPEPSWQCQLTQGLVYFVVEGNQPNAFHRFMQRICFGLKWSRIDD
jgi:hypothetical protein